MPMWRPRVQTRLRRRSPAIGRALFVGAWMTALACLVTGGTDRLEASGARAQQGPDGTVYVQGEAPAAGDPVVTQLLLRSPADADLGNLDFTLAFDGRLLRFVSFEPATGWTGSGVMPGMPPPSPREPCSSWSRRARRSAWRCFERWRLRAMNQRVSLCGVCFPHQRQYLRNSTRSGLFRFDFSVW